MLLDFNTDIRSQAAPAVKKKYVIQSLNIGKLEEILGHALSSWQKLILRGLLCGSLAMTSGNVGRILHGYLSSEKDKLFCFYSSDQRFERTILEYDQKRLREVFPGYKRFVVRSV